MYNNEATTVPLQNPVAKEDNRPTVVTSDSQQAIPLDKVNSQVQTLESIKKVQRVI